VIGRPVREAGMPASTHMPLEQLAKVVRARCAPRTDFSLALRAQLLTAATQRPVPTASLR
jgi:hypothetical protein